MRREPVFWTRARVAELGALLADGRSFRLAARALGVSVAAATNAAARHGLKSRHVKCVRAAPITISASSCTPPAPRDRWSDLARAALADGRARTLHEICGRKHALCEREIGWALEAMALAGEVSRREATGFCGPVIVYALRRPAARAMSPKARS